MNGETSSVLSLNSSRMSESNPALSENSTPSHTPTVQDQPSNLFGTSNSSTVDVKVTNASSSLFNLQSYSSSHGSDSEEEEEEITEDDAGAPEFNGQSGALSVDTSASTSGEQMVNGGGSSRAGGDVEGGGEGAEGNGGENPWESPRIEPVDGIVQPRVIAPIGKPTRHTNQLDYLQKEVLRAVLKHKHSFPFAKPVEAGKLKLHVSIYLLTSRPRF